MYGQRQQRQCTGTADGSHSTAAAAAVAPSGFEMILQCSTFIPLPSLEGARKGIGKGRTHNTSVKKAFTLPALLGGRRRFQLSPMLMATMTTYPYRKTLIFLLTVVISSTQ